jgi:hypothetical protein
MQTKDSAMAQPVVSGEFAEKLAFSIPELAKAASIGRTSIYSEVAAGRLITTKIGRRTVVTRQHALAWLDAAAARAQGHLA